MRKISKLLVHPVDFDCNMACRYCYNGSWRKPADYTQRVISEEILRKLFKESCELVLGHRLQVIWHGGEPLLAGKDFYQNAVKIQQEVFQGRFRIENGIQTNGTLIDREWVSLFKELGISPSLSFDGNQYHHDSMRVFLDGSPTYKKVMEGYNLLRSEGMKAGLMMVISKINVREPDQIWQWVLEEKIQNFDFLPCFEPERYRNGEMIYTVDEDEIVYFATRLFDLWFDHADPLIRIRTFKEVIQGQLGGRIGICSWKGNCSTYASIDPRGNIFLCGRYHCFPETCLGNITKNTLGEILENQKTQLIDQEIIRGQQKCRSCRWYSICFSGCPFLKYAISRKWDTHYLYCQYRQRLFSHIRKRITA